jgi:penicillin-binding protein 1A
MQRNIPLSTKIYDRTGTVLLKELHGDEKRTLIKIEDIPENVKWATISVEDKGFYSHHGINFPRMIKAILIDILERRRAQGASTLTQQFIKNAVLTNEKNLDRKIKEIKKNRHGMLQSGIEGTIKPLADERERIISKIPFLK